MSLEIREASARDAETLLAMMPRYYAHDHIEFEPARARRGLEGLFRDPSRGRIWISELDGAPIGYAVLCLGYSLECGGIEAFVDELYVREDLRGQGIGERLLRHVIARSPTLGVRQLRLEVTGHNARAQNLYKRLGFEDWGRSLLALPMPEAR